MFRQKLEVIVLSEGLHTEFQQRLQEVFQRFYINTRQYSLSEFQVLSHAEKLCHLVILSPSLSSENLKPTCDMVWKELPSAFVLALPVNPEASELKTISSSGALMILKEFDFYKTMKLEYIVGTRVRGRYFKSGVQEVFPMSSVPFSAYLPLALNQKYLKVISEGEVLSEAKYQKLIDHPTAEHAFYVPLQQASAYKEYINQYFDKSGNGFKKRLRASLITLLKDVTSCVSLSFGLFPDETLLKECMARIDAEFPSTLELLTMKEDVWEEILSLSNEDFGFSYPGFFVGIYGTLLSVKLQIGNPFEVFWAGIFADIGVYDLPKTLVENYFFARQNQSLAELNQNDEFKKHPTHSLNRLLSLPSEFSANVKAMVVSHEERQDEQGYPHQVPKTVLPFESQLVHFAALVYYESQSTLKITKTSFRFMREKIWQTEVEQKGRFSEAFLQTVASALV